MKIEIDYNGGIPVCRLEPADQPGKTLDFLDADIEYQKFALCAFRKVKECWQREQERRRYMRLPVMRVRQEFQVTMQNLDKIQELTNEGVIVRWSFDKSRTPTAIVTLADEDETTVTDHGWLMQDTDGVWHGMSNTCRRIMLEYSKLIIEKEG